MLRCYLVLDGAFYIFGVEFYFVCNLFFLVCRLEYSVKGKVESRWNLLLRYFIPNLSPNFWSIEY